TFFIRLVYTATTARALTRLTAHGEFRDVAVESSAIMGSAPSAASRVLIQRAGGSRSIRDSSQRLPIVSTAAATAAPQSRPFATLSTAPPENCRSSTSPATQSSP